MPGVWNLHRQTCLLPGANAWITHWFSNRRQRNAIKFLLASNPAKRQSCWNLTLLSQQLSVLTVCLVMFTMKLLHQKVFVL